MFKGWEDARYYVMLNSLNACKQLLLAHAWSVVACKWASNCVAYIRCALGVALSGTPPPPKASFIVADLASRLGAPGGCRAVCSVPDITGSRHRAVSRLYSNNQFMSWALKWKNDFKLEYDWVLKLLSILACSFIGDSTSRRNRHLTTFTNIKKNTFSRDDLCLIFDLRFCIWLEVTSSFCR